MSRELFQRNKELANHWRRIAHSIEFEQVLTFARSEIVRHGPDQAELKGVERLAHTLSTLADAEESSFAWPSSGLDHQAEVPPNRPNLEPTPKRKKK